MVSHLVSAEMLNMVWSSMDTVWLGLNKPSSGRWKDSRSDCGETEERERGVCAYSITANVFIR